MANGILVPVVDFSGMAEDEFNDWYDLEHIPQRLGVAGFLACERWIAADNPRISVATYVLDNADVLKSPAYNAVGNHAGGSDRLSVWSKRVTARMKTLMRFEGDQIMAGGGVAPKDAPALLLNAMSVAPEHEDEFNEWYNTEYLLGNMTVNGVYGARRYLNRGTGPRYLTVYEFAHTEVSRQPAWDRARAQSVWRRRIERLWTHAPGSPGIYRRLAAR